MSAPSGLSLLDGCIDLRLHGAAAWEERPSILRALHVESAAAVQNTQRIQCERSSETPQRLYLITLIPGHQSH
jgi:hypothetical protein